MSVAAPTGAMAEARSALLEAGGREATGIAASVEGLRDLPAFSAMAHASLAARPQWAGLVDDLFERPLLKTARAGLRNALMATLRGDTLYRNVFFSFTDAVILWHYGHTQQRTGRDRLDVIYAVMLRLLDGADRFGDVASPPEPDVAFFHRLRRVRLTQDNAYVILRRSARLMGAVESVVTGEKLHPVRGSMLTSYASFSAQVMAMARALREGRDAITRQDVLAGFAAFTRLAATPPGAFGTRLTHEATPADPDDRRGCGGSPYRG